MAKDVTLALDNAAVQEGQCLQSREIPRDPLNLHSF